MVEFAQYCSGRLGTPRTHRTSRRSLKSQRHNRPNRIRSLQSVMLVYRIVGKKHSDDLTGAGAAMSGGRWNKNGTPVLYTGVSKEIALLETVVHTPAMFVPKLDIVSIEIPDDSITVSETDLLPLNWKSYPAPTVLSEIGEQWVNAAETIALKVPSCIIHTAYNFIFNCRHRDYGKVKPADKRNFEFDSRMIR